jgi:hypothetical protein
MSIANVDITNSLEYFRLVTNQCIQVWNYVVNDNFVTSGNLIVNPPAPVTGLVALNVTNGLIYANGSGLFSYPNTGTTGIFTSSQLQNTSVTFGSGAGIAVGTSSSSLNTDTITITSNPIDSITNTSLYLPAAANAIQRLIGIVGGTVKTLGRFFVNVGGTGMVSYTNGQILLSNALGTVIANTIAGRPGIIVANGAGSITISANLVQGANVSITGTGALTVSQNAQPVTNTNVIGVARLIDNFNSSSTTDVATANTLNAVAKIVSQGAGAISINAHGRLYNVISWSGSTDAPISRTFTPNMSLFSFAIVTVVAQGAPGACANNGNSYIQYAVGSGGGAGASLTGIITASDIINFDDDAGGDQLTINVGTEPSKIQTPTTTGVYPASVVVGNVDIGVRGTDYIFRVEGGKTPMSTGNTIGRLLINIGISHNTIAGTGTGNTYYQVARAFSNAIYGTVLQKSSGQPGQPGVVINKGASTVDTVLVSPYVAAFAGHGGEAIWALSGAGDSIDQISTIYGGTVPWTAAGEGSGRFTDNGEDYEDRNHLDAGNGGPGALSCGYHNDGYLFKQPGGYGGGYYIRIESYTNA